jgi:hypothetical protein
MANRYGFKRRVFFMNLKNVTEICVENLRNGIKSLRMRSNLGEI